MKETYLIILRLPLVVGEKPRLKHKIPHVNKGPAELPPPISYHPPFVHDLGRHRFNSNATRVRLGKSTSETEILTDSEAPIATFGSSETTLSLCNLITHGLAPGSNQNQIISESVKT